MSISIHSWICKKYLVARSSFNYDWEGVIRTFCKWEPVEKTRGLLPLVDSINSSFVCLDAAGGHAKTLMFVQLNPELSSYSETLSTLKFAERVSGVELGAARTNKEGRDVRDFMEQVLPCHYLSLVCPSNSKQFSCILRFFPYRIF